MKFPKFADPAVTISVIKAIDKKTSYEIICADERNAPKNAYLELELHPERTIA